MRENDPRVSVVIPVYNCERYLAAAIESTLAQSSRSLEVIVVNDGSTDSSEAVARRFGPPVQCFCQPHWGIGAARNQGVKLARGGFLAFLDADDLWMKDKITLQLAAFQEAPDLQAVFGQVEQFLSPELDEETRAKFHLSGEVLAGLAAGTMLVRRDFFLETGGFTTDFKIGEFLEWYAAAKEMGMKYLLLPQVLLKRRLHTGNTGIREAGARADYLRILKASLDRRRKSGSKTEG